MGRKSTRLVCLIAACLWMYQAVESSLRDAPTSGESKAVVSTLVMIGISIALTALSAALAKRQSRATLQDEKPTVLTSRGATLPRITGRAFTSYAIMHVQSRFTRSESVGKKSDAFSPEQDIFYETGLHVCMVGPAHRLLRITQDGETIFRGPIDPQITPSGVTVNVGSEGSFKIFWGSGDQPAIAGIAAAMGLTMLSRDPTWPWHTIICWTQKRLGPTPTWRLLQYEWERQPNNSQLQGSSPWFVGSRGAQTQAKTIDAVVSGNPGTNKITVSGNIKSDFPNGSECKLESVGGPPDGFYPVLDASKNGSNTDIFIDATLTGLTTGGTIRSYAFSEDSGANGAHILDEVLHEPFPHGAGVPREDFDHASLDALGVLMESENLRMRFVANSGEQAKAIVAMLMQDMGVMVPWIARDKKFRWVPLREPQVGMVPTLAVGTISGAQPSIRSRLDEPDDTQVIYVFEDQTRNFRENWVEAFDDSWAFICGAHNMKKIALKSTSVLGTATAIKNRRGQEALPHTVNTQIFATREARELYPGLPLVVPGFPQTLRVMGVRIKPLSSKVTLTVLNDNYGLPASTFIDPDSGGIPTLPTGPLEDLGMIIVEVPWLFHKTTGTVLVIVARIRDNLTITNAEINLSADDITYGLKGIDSSAFTGGTLDANLAADTRMVIDLGPVFNIEGPDIAIVEDLTSDPTNFRLGRQVVVIEDSSGNQEILHTDSVTVLGGGQAQLGKTIRGRYGTPKIAFAAGDRLYIFRSDTVQSFSDLLIAAQANLYVKAAPRSGQALDLASVTADSKLPLVGEGVAPMLPANFRTTNFRNTFGTGEDVPLKWAYRTKAGVMSGAGDIGAGLPQTAAAIEGGFTLFVRNSGGSLINTRSMFAVASFNYSNAFMVSDFGSEQAVFILGIAPTHNGVELAEQQITITRV